jgi:phenylacetate-CoA ligase
MAALATAWWQVTRGARLSRPALDRLVWRRLRHVLVSAFRHVPYYREVMTAAGYDPGRDYTGPADLAVLPVTRKETLRSQGARCMHEGVDLRDSFTDSTSGSTGIPLRVHRSRRGRALEMAKWLRVLAAGGYSPHWRVLASVAPSRVGTGRHPLQRIGLLRRRTMDYVHTAPEAMADVLLDYRPQLFYGNRPHGDLVALELLRRGVRPQGLRTLVVGGEVLGAHHRARYRDAFGVEAIESYGTVETGVLAFETPVHDGLHLCEDLTHFEFLDANGRPAGPGQPGRVVVTDLTATVMPFLRYDVGDLAVFEEHRDRSGAIWRRLSEVVGRDNDFAVLADGRQIAAPTLYRSLTAFDRLHQFRIVQEAADRFRLVVAGESDYLSGQQPAMVAAVRDALGAPASIIVERVDRIDLDRGGKLRSFVRECS